MNRGKWGADKNGNLIPYVEPPKRDVNAPMVIVDEMDPMLSMADRRIYTSKRRYRDSLRRHGFIEVGNETNYVPKREEDPKYEENLRADIARAAYDVRDGNAELTEFDKERCKIVNKQIRDSYDTRERDELGRLVSGRE